MGELCSEGCEQTHINVLMVVSETKWKQLCNKGLHRPFQPNHAVIQFVGDSVCAK